MYPKTVRASVTRKISAATARMRRRGSKARPTAPEGKTRRRLRFLRWAIVVHLLKGAAYACGGFLAQVLLARLLGG